MKQAYTFSIENVKKYEWEDFCNGYALNGNLPTGARPRVCFITAGPITKLCAWGEEESGGHVL